MLTVSELYIYPVKSMGGVQLNSAELTDRGFKYDRRWMLVDEQHEFLSQRQLPAMALLQTVIINDGILVYDKRHPEDKIIIPFVINVDTIINVQIWNNICRAIIVSNEVNNWFSNKLKRTCKLVYMPDEERRKVDSNYASHGEITSFSDGYPVLIIGKSSLDDLNKRMAESISINRFRPNIVFAGGYAYEEDEMEVFGINEILFNGVKLCSRCAVTTIEQSNAEQGKEPLQTLSTYREVNNRIYFGQNVVYRGNGIISIGDQIKIIKKKDTVFK